MSTPVERTSEETPFDIPEGEFCVYGTVGILHLVPQPPDPLKIGVLHIYHQQAEYSTHHDD